MVAMSTDQSDLEVAKRALKNAEIELAEARSYVHELVISIEFVNANHQRLESDIATLNQNLTWKTHNAEVLVQASRSLILHVKYFENGDRYMTMGLMEVE